MDGRPFKEIIAFASLYPKNDDQYLPPGTVPLLVDVSLSLKFKMSM